MNPTTYKTSTKTLGINGAFLQEIKEDHIELRDLLAKTQRACKQHSQRGKPRELVYLLLALQDRLAIHFSLEEAYGYCDEALAVAPRLSSEAEALRAEHRTLFTEFCQLADEAEQLLMPIPMRGSLDPPITLQEVAAQYERFREALEEHEQREVELILAAYDDDIGGGD